MHQTSMILAVHDGEQELAQTTIDFLCDEFGDEDVELIVMDDVETQSLTTAYNRGALQAQGDTLLFLRPLHYLFLPVYRRMMERLWRDEKVGAVGPQFTVVTDEFRGRRSPQELDVLRKNCLRSSDAAAQEENATFILTPSCLMVKKEVWQKESGFNEEYTGLSPLVGIDLSLRLWRAKREVLVLSDCKVFRELCMPESHPSFDTEEMQRDNHPFFERWHIRPGYSLNSRFELLGALPLEEKGFAMLEAGCACGATLMAVKHRNPTADLYGIELDSNAAEIAKNFAQIHNLDLETLSMPEWKDKFDAIVMGDILEHLRDPWKTLANMHEILKPDGQIVISVPNIMHISIFEGLLKGGAWDYQPAGILDRTHLRFFTKKSVMEMLTGAGFRVEQISYSNFGQSPEQKKLREKLKGLLAPGITPEQLDAYQWIAVAGKA